MRWFMSRNTSPRDDKRSKPKGWIRGNTKIGPVLEVKVTNYLERDGIEVKIGSMQNDGSQSWIVISRGIIKYVTELPEENDKPLRRSGIWFGETRCHETTGTIHTIFIFIFFDCYADRRKWNDIAVVGNMDEKSFKISKQMTRLLRRQGHPREMMKQLSGEGCCLRLS